MGEGVRLQVQQSVVTALVVRQLREAGVDEVAGVQVFHEQAQNEASVYPVGLGKVSGDLAGEGHANDEGLVAVLQRCGCGAGIGGVLFGAGHTYFLRRGVDSVGEYAVCVSGSDQQGSGSVESVQEGLFIEKVGGG